MTEPRTLHVRITRVVLDPGLGLDAWSLGEAIREEIAARLAGDRRATRSAGAAAGIADAVIGALPGGDRA